MSDVGDLQSADAGVRLRALDEIRAGVAAGEKDPAAEARRLLVCLGDPVKRVQRGCAELLGRLAAEDSSVERLVAEALEAADPRVRWGAAFAQAALGRVSVAAAAVWIDSLGSSDKDLRWAAHDLIVRHLASVPAALERLRAAARDTDTERRKMALYCLRDLGVADDGRHELALAGLATSDIGVRLAALAALPKVTPDAATSASALCPYLADSDARVRRAAAATLGNLGVCSAAVESGLLEASRSQDAGLQRAAQGALLKLKSSGPA